MRITLVQFLNREHVLQTGWAQILIFKNILTTQATISR